MGGKWAAHLRRTKSLGEETAQLRRYRVEGGARLARQRGVRARVAGSEVAVGRCWGDVGEMVGDGQGAGKVETKGAGERESKSEGEGEDEARARARAKAKGEAGGT